MSKIFIIEDDQHLASRLVQALSDNSFEACACRDISQWKAEWDAFAPDLTLLDINLQTANGYMVCVELRRQTLTPIIFITGREAEADEIRALNIGGDDYLRKPFSDAVLLAHVGRQLKNHSFEYRDSLKSAGLELNIGKRSVANMANGLSVELSNMEFQIMFFLFGSEEKPSPRGALMDYLWDNRCYVDENALNVNLSRLRRKLSQIGAGCAIQTVKGEGLRLS